MLALAAATILAFVLLGYHPYAEDGGIYSAALAARLDPSLFPWDRVFVVAHTRFAFFVPLCALLVRVLHVAPETMLLLLHVAGLCALLAAGMHLARTCMPAVPRWVAALSLATGVGLPVAGTSLYAVDPYCTGRSLTSPLLLFALSFALRERWFVTAGLWAVAALLHPLMALWSGLALVFGFIGTRHKRGTWLLLFVAMLGIVCALLKHYGAPESTALQAAVGTRLYWFPAEWRWYEWLGAIAPPGLLLWFASRPDASATLRHCAGVCAVTTLCATSIALLFAHESASSYAVARLQPMRALHLVFLTFLALLAPSLSLRLQSPMLRRFAFLGGAAAAVGVFTMQRATFLHTRHIEWPGTLPDNPWEQAFAWCRDHTAAGALIALPATYINLPEEDSHGFRAIAHRSTLSDVVKDAGVTAVLPELAADWERGVRATRDLQTIREDERRRRLLPLRVTWLVLPTSARTALPCPYTNLAAKVCRLQE